MKFRFKKTLIAVAAIAACGVVFVTLNNPRRETIMPVRTVTLTVAPQAEAEFAEKVRKFAVAEKLGIANSQGSPENLVILLRDEDREVNITRYGVGAPVSAAFYKGKGLFPASTSQLNADAAEFIAAVTQIPGVVAVR
jgi:hypothetical protein